MGEADQPSKDCDHQEQPGRLAAPFDEVGVDGQLVLHAFGGEPVSASKESHGEVEPFSSFSAAGPMPGIESSSA